MTTPVYAGVREDRSWASKTDFLRQGVERMCTELGLLFSGSGNMMVAAGPGGVVFAFLRRTYDDQVSDGQAEFLARLSGLRLRCYRWCPDDLGTGRIRAELRKIS